MARSLLAFALTSLSLSLVPADTAAQQRPLALWPEPVPAVAERTAASAHAATNLPPLSPPAPAQVFVYSALLPGAGQYVLEQRRAFVYLGMEAAAWLFWLDRRRDGHDLRHAYRDLAWSTARDGGGAPRTDGDFDYYETLLYWTRSGAWDVDASSPELEPETDPTTFNGAIWTLARQLFFPADADQPVMPSDHAYAQALEYYRERAYGPGFLWDWTGHGESRERYVGLLEESDDRFQQATIALGLVAANHLLSAADAFVSARLREATAGRLDTHLTLSTPGRHAGPIVRWPGTRGRAEGLPTLALGIRIRY